MSNFNWAKAANAFKDFGGQDKVLHIPKTGLPFFDVLRLYGAIELRVGLQQEVYIHDAGNEWQVKAKVREHRLKDIKSVAATLKKGRLSRRDEQWIEQLKAALAGDEWPDLPLRDVSTPLDNPDSALKDGVRDAAASSYSGLETGYGKKSKVPFADALLAYAGQERTESVAGIYFLPVFKGRVDFSKVVSPLRAWIGVPNVLCAQALTLLALKTSLFAEGYAEQLSAVVYNTNFDSRKFFNYSGVIEIESTALSKSRNAKPDFIGHFYRTFRGIVSRAWKRKGGGYEASSKPEDTQPQDAFAHAYWLMQPSVPKHLSALVTSLEKLRWTNKPIIVAEAEKGYVKEVFEMTYGKKWEGDHEAVRKFARAVASAIWSARQEDFVKGVKDPNKLKEARQKAWKAWYDEVTMLRSAPTARAFKERALILLEQGKQRNHFIGSSISQFPEDFDPAALLESIGEGRANYEKFRDLFRMYLVQESGPKKRADVGLAVGVPEDTALTGDESEEDQTTGGSEE